MTQDGGTEFLSFTKATVGEMLIRPPFSTTGLEPLARVALHLTDETALHDMLVASVDYCCVADSCCKIILKK